MITKYLGDFAENPSIGMALGMKIDVLATMAEDVNKELTKIKKNNN